MEPSPTKVVTTTEIIDGVPRVKNTITGTTINTVCVVTFVDPSQDPPRDYPFWDQPVQDRIDEFIVEGTRNFIGIINVKNKKLFSMKFPSLEVMQLGMEKVGRRYGFPVPKFETSNVDHVSFPV